VAAKVDLTSELIELAADCELDPHLFAETAFLWGEGELKGKKLRKWQAEYLEALGEKLRAGEITTHEAIQNAISSGHGIGKSALVSILIMWALTTMENTKGVVTANTETQLKTKTWAELAKWYRLCIFRDWFTFTATALFSSDSEHEKTWRIDMVPWSERNTEAFAGLHNEGKRILLVFDEASAIPDIIWEVSEGALTDEDTQIIWAVFGNPTRNTGRFKSCFGNMKHRWNNRRIDSRTVEGTNKEQFRKWEEDHGEDSDFFRVRVRGEFPKAAGNQLISSAAVEYAVKNELYEDEYSFQSIIIGCDVARYGDDETVITVRQGRKVLEQLCYRELDNVQVALKVAEIYRKYSNATIMVDEIGVGAGVVDYLKNMNYPVMGVNVGKQADEKDKFFNVRAEIWYRMKEWVEAGADIPGDRELCEQLASPEYSYTPKEQIKLEKKEDMKARGLSSPDRADSLALTFAYFVAPQMPSSFEPEEF
jgi:post-segregation antitoxin (ccd killing protein)